MKRKLLPVFLSFALLANGSLTAFAADPVADAVTESDVQTTVSENQENQEEVTFLKGKLLKKKLRMKLMILKKLRMLLLISLVATQNLAQMVIL